MARTEPQGWFGEKWSSEAVGEETIIAIAFAESNLEQQHMATLLSHGLTVISHEDVFGVLCQNCFQQKHLC